MVAHGDLARRIGHHIPVPFGINPADNVVGKVRGKERQCRPAEKDQAHKF
jgi:hypothetical protein